MRVKIIIVEGSREALGQESKDILLPLRFEIERGVAGYWESFQSSFRTNRVRRCTMDNLETYTIACDLSSVARAFSRAGEKWEENLFKNQMLELKLAGKKTGDVVGSLEVQTV